MRIRNLTPKFALVAVVGAAILLTGCETQHYRVTDPNTGRVFYTTKWGSNTYSGANAIKIRSSKTGRQYVIENPQIEEISKEEHDAGIQ